MRSHSHRERSPSPHCPPCSRRRPRQTTAGARGAKTVSGPFIPGVVRRLTAVAAEGMALAVYLIRSLANSMELRNDEGLHVTFGGRLQTRHRALVRRTA